MTQSTERPGVFFMRKKSSAVRASVVGMATVFVHGCLTPPPQPQPQPQAVPEPSSSVGVPTENVVDPATSRAGLGAVATQATAEPSAATSSSPVEAVAPDPSLSTSSESIVGVPGLVAAAEPTPVVQNADGNVPDYGPLCVSFGNTRSLGAAALPIATYLNAMHDRIHPIFHDRFLESLRTRPQEDPIQSLKVSTTVEIAVGGTSGALEVLRVVSTSHIQEFDDAANEAITLAAPFGAVPPDFLSPDGNAYLHWEFFRNQDYACSPYFIHPYILHVAPPGNCRFLVTTVPRLARLMKKTRNSPAKAQVSPGRSGGSVRRAARP